MAPTGPGTYGSQRGRPSKKKPVYLVYASDKTHKTYHAGNCPPLHPDIGEIFFEGLGGWWAIILMPFKTKQQRRYLFKFKPKLAKKWAKKYGYKVKKSAKS